MKRVDILQLFYLLILCFLVYIHFIYMSCLKNENSAFQPEKRQFVAETNFSRKQESPNIAVKSDRANSLSSVQQITDKMDKYEHVTKPPNSSLKTQGTKNTEIRTSTEGGSQG